MLLLEGLLLLYEAYMIALDYLFLMRFYGILIYDYVYVIMFDYVVQVGELLEFLSVNLHNQFNNTINHC